MSDPRQLVRDVLAGKTTPESNPQVFADDLLMHAMGALSTDDPAWLEEALGDASYPATTRFALLGQSALPDATRLRLLEALVPDLPAEIQGQTEGFVAFLRARSEGSEQST